MPSLERPRQGLLIANWLAHILSSLLCDIGFALSDGLAVPPHPLELNQHGVPSLRSSAKAARAAAIIPSSGSERPRVHSAAKTSSPSDTRLTCASTSWTVRSSGGATVAVRLCSSAAAPKRRAAWAYCPCATARPALNATVRRMRASTQDALIAALNAQMRAWCPYYRHVLCVEAFNDCDHAVYAMLRRWSRRRHPNKSARWIAARYWHESDGQRWFFRVPDGIRLIRHTAMHQEQYIKVRGMASPYDGNLIYWSRRLRTHWAAGTPMARLLRRQRGRCSSCGLTFRDGDRLEMHHIVRPADGGTNLGSNLQALHVHCHDQLTARQQVEWNGSPRQGLPSRGAV